MENGMTLIEQYAVPWLVKIVIALAIFLIGKMVARSLTNFITRLLVKSRIDSMLVKFLSNLLYALLLIAVVLAAIEGLGINVTSLLAIVGAAGLAVGLALKDSLSNFAAGIMIIVFRPFRIGDSIVAGGSSGMVDEIGMFCTIMHTPDNQRIIIPNSAVIGGTIVNASALPTRRIDLLFAISYGDNIGQAKAIIEKVIAKDERILMDPASTIGVAALADSSVNLFARPWVLSADYGDVQADLLENIKGELESAGITMPIPQRAVYMHTVEKP